VIKIERFLCKVDYYTKIKTMDQSIDRYNLINIFEYATSLIGVPFRWYDEGSDMFVGTDKFWCENSPPPSALEINNNDKSIVCSGFINLLRRKCGLSIPGLHGNIRGKYKNLFTTYPGGTGAWFLYLHQRKRLEKLNMNMKYPKGTLLLARFKDNETDQGHVAVVYNDVDDTKNINDQLIIHSSPDILYADREKFQNHGCVKVEPFCLSNNEWRYKHRSYYTYVCYPENWLVLD
jgi:hypothetical protein